MLAAWPVDSGKQRVKGSDRGGAATRRGVGKIFERNTDTRRETRRGELSPVDDSPRSRGLCSEQGHALLGTRIYFGRRKRDTR